MTFITSIFFIFLAHCFWGVEKEEASFGVFYSGVYLFGILFRPSPSEQTIDDFTRVSFNDISFNT